MPSTLPRIRPLAAGLALAALTILPAAAQRPAETGTGGGPASTVTAPNTSSVGRTKPPGAAAGGPSAGDRTERTPQQKEDDRIQKGICIGCAPR
ncbi:hypothetical protein [Methylobacterium oxalidis]|uniref:Uncharacterized protein n=1 Tax=Methylobacterium oxalidis TaxID=944322 RepID=A0A512J9X4_9HYPH|nr:hypothetical protein [Methylobacterium oxalidis]GEP06764.1 hypothetical protein MOX02_48020 [Methylobacterium oxalidis]GJE35588.1 hypothetical protein LDDCCGHA_5807 [Methylobacterium oxalidis]GLS67972.1 hypothetical protein GCM10007888_63570 [Methylobacterium oxalidis]